MNIDDITQSLSKQLTDMISNKKKECEYIYSENDHDFYAEHIKTILIQLNGYFPEKISLSHFPSSGQKGKITFTYYYDASQKANAIQCLFVM